MNIYSKAGLLISTNLIIFSAWAYDYDFTTPRPEGMPSSNVNANNNAPESSGYELQMPVVEAPLPVEPSTQYPPGSAEQWGAKQQAPNAGNRDLVVILDLNFDDTTAMNNKVAIGYKYFDTNNKKYMDSRTAESYKNHSQDQVLTVPRDNKVGFIELSLIPAGSGPVVCFLNPQDKGSSYILDNVMQVRLIGTSDAWGHHYCQLNYE